MKISIYIATSLDDFIARPDGDIEWLFYVRSHSLFPQEFLEGA